MGLYRKKTVAIEAIQHTGHNRQEVCDFRNQPIGDQYLGQQIVEYIFEDGDGTACVGDYIIKKADGKFRGCKGWAFEAEYEAV